jgi:FkbM family methyltransferase
MATILSGGAQLALLTERFARVLKGARRLGARSRRWSRKRSPRGVDPLREVRAALPQVRFEQVFDVGANLGQSAREFLRSFPDAVIHCFEPATATFRELEANLAGNPRVHCHRLALGAAVSKGTLKLEGSSAMYHLLSDDAARELPGTPREEVAIDTLDRFSERHGVRHINYLKIDTEGSDLAALAGAESLLARQAVDLVQVEAGMNPTNERHVPLETLKAHLESKGYRLFGIYSQAIEWPTQQIHLRRSNCVFVSAKLVAQSGRAPA